MKSCRQLLSLLKVRTRQHLQHLLDAAPARSGQDLGQADAEWRVATVHVRDVVGVLGRVDKVRRCSGAFGGGTVMDRSSDLLVGVLHPQLQGFSDGGVVVPRAALRLQETSFLQVVQC